MRADLRPPATSQSHRARQSRVRLSYDGLAPYVDTLAPALGRPMWNNESGPGSAGNTHRSLTHTDRLQRSEGCRAGYPNSDHLPRYFGRPSVTGRSARRALDRDRQRAILRAQGYVCGYCAVPFGSVIRKRNRMLISAVHFDHVVPFAYLNTNPSGNWIAACNFCNLVKSSMVFHSLSEIRAYVLDVRDRRGDEVEWFAPISSEEDPERWAVQFASFLTRVDPLESVGREDDEPFTPRVRERVKRRNFSVGPWSR